MPFWVVCGCVLLNEHTRTHDLARLASFALAFWTEQHGAFFCRTFVVPGRREHRLWFATRRTARMLACGVPLLLVVRLCALPRAGRLWRRLYRGPGNGVPSADDRRGRASAGRAMVSPRAEFAIAGGVLVLLLVLHAATYQPSEPFYNTDEARHVMTGIFFRDALAAAPLGALREYAVQYFVQYPALGVVVWPPFFYAVEGLAMLALGTGVLVAKVLVLGFLGLAGAYLFALVRRTHGVPAAALAVLLFALSPLVFVFSRQVMLEVPTVALGLMSTYHFRRFLDVGSRRDLALAAAGAVAAMTTRFDAVYLLPLFGLMLLGGRRLDVLRRWDLWVAVALAAIAITPVYAIVAREVGWYHSVPAVDGVPGRAIFTPLRNLTFYVAALPGQLGWACLVSAAVGLSLSLRSEARARTWTYWSIIGATYLTFTPLAELESRHTIYWIPAFATFAAIGALELGRRCGPAALRMAPAVLVLAATAWLTVRQPAFFVHGYAPAARYVTSEDGAARRVLFDGALNGAFIFQVRRHDPARRLAVLRGDKLFYSGIEVASNRYTEFVQTEAELLQTIYRYDPAFVVVEEPLAHEVPMARRLRAVLQAHPDRFRLARVFPVDSNVQGIRGRSLRVYRNVLRNPAPDREVAFEMLLLRRRIGATPP